SSDLNGLVAYDGAYWTLYHLDNKSFARSVAVAPDGKIYVGGKEEFGYYEQTGTGLRYRKLSHLVDPDILENDEIWKILFVSDGIMFQSFSKYYLYKSRKIEVHYGNGEPFLFAH